jgi:O-6-methylguanine DNA methyltransferase
VFIFISYDYNENQGKLLLNNIQFFKSEKDVIDYVKESKLKLADKNDLNEQKIVEDLINLIGSYLKGEKVNLYSQLKELKIEIPFDKLFSSSFSKKVIQYLIDNINHGKIISYSEIGENIGSKAYRAIGNIMKNNQLPLLIPCHRVIRKDGAIGGYAGRFNNSWQQNLKMELLKLEGALK